MNHFFENNPAVREVYSLSELFQTKMKHPVNCLRWQREITGDFDGLAEAVSEQYEESGGYFRMSIDHFASMNITGNAAIHLARETVLSDLEDITRLNVGAPLLVLREPNETDKQDDVFHLDGLKIRRYTENTLCCYNKPTTECIRYEHARVSSLSTECYEAIEGAEIGVFDVGHMYRYLGNGFECPGLPFPHRKPRQVKPRLFTSVLKGVF